MSFEDLSFIIRISISNFLFHITDFLIVVLKIYCKMRIGGCCKEQENAGKDKELFIYYVRKIFWKTDISYSLICTRTCAY